MVGNSEDNTALAFIFLISIVPLRESELNLTEANIIKMTILIMIKIVMPFWKLAKLKH